MSQTSEPGHTAVPSTSGPTASEPSSEPRTSSRARRLRLPARVVVLAVGYAMAYAVLARLSLVLLDPNGIAIFWPCAGLSVGLLLGFGRQAQIPVLVGTALGTVIANLTSDRTPGLAVAFGLLNSLEVWAVNYFLWQYGLRTRSQSQFHAALAFFGSAAIATALAGFLAAIVLVVAGADANRLISSWRAWAQSDFVGIAVISPTVLAVVALVRQPARRHQWSEDLALLLVFLLAAQFSLSTPIGSAAWQAVAPGATILPVLIWLSARAQPIVPAMSIVILAGLLAYNASMGIGRFGEPSIPFETRVFAAQASLTAGALATSCISALFAERRAAAERLAESERRMAAIAETSPGVIFTLERSADGRLRFPYVAPTALGLLDMSPEHVAATAEPLIARMTPDSAAAFYAAIDGATSREALQIEFELTLPGARAKWLELNARPEARPDGTLAWHGIMQDVTDRRHRLDEIRHRTRNLLAVVQAVAERTVEKTGPVDFPEAFGRRLDAIAASQDLLAAREWRDVQIEPLLRSQLAHVSDLIDTRLTLAGPPVLLKRRVAEMLGMAVHELATNALKHGALKAPEGRIVLMWDVAHEPSGRTFRIRWDEQDGVTLNGAARQGFGSSVTMAMVSRELGVRPTLESQPGGLVWQLNAQADLVVAELSETRS